jgi:glycosyltransferase involved in cell wall biosynthesis
LHRRRGDLPRLFYGGARSGNIGGPLVKVKRLQHYFPQSRWRYNLVYTLSNAPYLSALTLDWLSYRRIKIVLNQNGVFYSGWYAGDWQRENSFMASAYHRADYVFWQSEFCRRATNLFLGRRERAGEVLFNAVDIDYYFPAPTRNDRPFTFLITGKIGTHLNYRLESTISALAMVRRAGLNSRLIIAGWIEEATGAKVLAACHGVSDFVSFLGPYSQENAPDIYRSADAYVMTKYLDPCPNTVIEAMACGLPVLYSASGGVPELVGNAAGVGLPVPEDWETIHVPSAGAIAEGMLKISQERDQMSAAARDRAVACFDIRNWIDRHRAVFDTLLRAEH